MLKKLRLRQKNGFLIKKRVVERTNLFSKMYDILVFLNFLNLPQITQYSFFIFFVIENILVLLYHSSHNHQEEINLCNLTKVSTHYRVVCLYSINICCDIFVPSEFFIFFRNIFDSEAINLICIITIHIQSYPLSSY